MGSTVRLRTSSLLARQGWTAPVAIAVSLLVAGCSKGESAGPTAGPPATVTAMKDFQAAAPGAPVPERPTVLVQDAAGRGVAGVTVAFAVQAGGGAIQATSAVTGGDGTASCGGWTLGAAAGLNVATATVAGLAPAVLTALGIVSSAEVTVRTVWPDAGVAWPERDATHYVATRVDSTYVLSSVTLTLQSLISATSRSTSLAFFDPGYCQTTICPNWNGSVSPDGLPWGPTLALVVATDVQGHSAYATRVFTMDRPPSITIASPAEGALVGSSYHLQVSCTDDDPAGCASVTAAGLSGKTGIDQVVPVPAGFEGGVTFQAYGTDSSGYWVEDDRTYYVVTNPRSHLLARLGGPIWDTLGSRVLFVDTPATTPVLKVRDLATGREDVLDAGFTAAYLRNDPRPRGRLGPGVALWLDADCRLHEWRGGAATLLDVQYACDLLEVAGPYALHLRGDAAGGRLHLVRRDLVAGTSQVVTDAFSAADVGLAANGDVVYTDRFLRTLSRWRDGVETRLPEPWPGEAGLYPLTDGTDVIYVTTTTPDSNGSSFTLYRWNGSTAARISETYETSLLPHAIAGGWVAFANRDSQGHSQFWRTGPGGAVQLTFFAADSTLDALAPDGTVVFSSGTKRYLAAAGGAPVEVGPALGSVVVRDGRFLQLLGPNLLELVP
jgi:hypothetical protein